MCEYVFAEAVLTRTVIDILLDVGANVSALSLLSESVKSAANLSYPPKRVILIEEHHSDGNQIRNKMCFSLPSSEKGDTEILAPNE